MASLPLSIVFEQAFQLKSLCMKVFTLIVRKATVVRSDYNKDFKNSLPHSGQDNYYLDHYEVGYS